MTLLDLEDQVVRMMAKHSERTSFALPNPAPPRVQTRDFLQHLQSKNRLIGDEVISALKDAATVEAKLRNVELSGLPASEKKKLRVREIESFVKRQESRKAKRLEKLATRLFEIRKEHEERSGSFPELMKRSGDLTEFSLRYRHMEEGDALARLAHIERHGGGSDAELAALAAVSPKAAKRAEEVRQATPSWMNAEAVEVRRKLEALVSVPFGEVPYGVEGTDVISTASLNDLIIDTFPTAEDLSIPEPVGQEA